MQSAKFLAASVTEMAFSFIKSDYHILLEIRFLVLVAQPELHGEILFVVFQAGHVAVFADDAAMNCSQRKMRRDDRGNSQAKVPDARFDPRLKEHQQPHDHGKE